jgi:Fe-S-cluster containining protein
MLTPSTRPRLHALQEVALGAAAPEGTDGRPACVAFEGKMGWRCGCSVYEGQPSVCREFEVGGDLRRQAPAGLPV